jgi:hypothetical protein
MLVDEKKMSPPGARSPPGHADINIRPAVIVDIDYGYPVAPSPRARDPGPVCYVFESKVSTVEIKFVGDNTTGKIKIGKPVPVEVTDPYAAAIVQELQIDRVDRIVFNHPVVEINARMRGRDLFEQGWMRVAAGQDNKEQGQ